MNVETLVGVGYKAVQRAAQTYLAEEQPGARPRRTIARFALKQAVKADPTLASLYV